MFHAIRMGWHVVARMARTTFTLKTICPMFVRWHFPVPFTRSLLLPLHAHIARAKRNLFRDQRTSKITLHINIQLGSSPTTATTTKRDCVRNATKTTMSTTTSKTRVKLSRIV